MSIAAVPTEYNGIRFRSKSEAVLARMLDLSNHGGFVYEPPGHIHAWDFEVVTPNCPWCGRRGLLIEYKPTEPTLAYVQNLIDKVRPAVERSKFKSFHSFLIWGNPWQPRSYGSCYTIYPIFTKLGKYGWGDFDPVADHGTAELFSYRHSIDILGFTKDMEQEAMEYRFDLKNA